MGAQKSAQLTKSVPSKCTVLDATITGSEKASAPNQTIAIAKRTTFLVITFFIGNRIAKLRSREIATKLKIEAIRDATWAELKNLHNTVPMKVPNHLTPT